LRQESGEIMGYFFKHNIHPYTECLKRQDTLEKYSQTIDLRVIYQEGYDLEGFIRGVAYREANRCDYCYHERLKSTARLAKRGKFDYFTTTLLYSKYQNHDTITESKRLGMYRQQYCGCIYSEKERFFR
jgi:predicted adenine nucleotide alpha hydrolase (AANH) superfamily ATPase